MDKEKRKIDSPLPENLDELLNEVQRQALPGIKFLGWEPRFLRTSLFLPPVLVLHNANDGRMGIMDENGRLAESKVREEENEDQTSSSPSELHYY